MLLIPKKDSVTTNLLWTYDQPSFKGNQVKMFWRDLVLPITNVTISDDQTAYNRVWYQIGDEGYAYSGDIQPVQTILNTPTLDIPKTGILGEVSVPFTDALDKPDSSSPFGYRLYYESVHWIKRAVTNQQNGKIWYQVLDDKWNQIYMRRANIFASFRTMNWLRSQRIFPMPKSGSKCI